MSNKIFKNLKVSVPAWHHITAARFKFRYITLLILCGKITEGSCIIILLIHTVIIWTIFAAIALHLSGHWILYLLWATNKLTAFSLNCTTSVTSLSLELFRICIHNCIVLLFSTSHKYNLLGSVTYSLGFKVSF